MTATDTESGLLAAILAQPADDLPRLVYADHLDEVAGGYDPRAEFIRCQIELANAPPPMYHDSRFDQYTPVYAEPWQTLRTRERELAVHAVDWWNLPVPVHTGFGAPPPGTVGVMATRGFVSHVTASLATLYGGECERCGGDGTIQDPYDVYDVDIPDRCPACSGTGRTTGILPALVRCQPVTEVRVSGVYIYYDAMMEVAVVHENQLPADVYPLLYPHASHVRDGYVYFPTADLARQSLSDALIWWAKSQH